MVTIGFLGDCSALWRQTGLKRASAGWGRMSFSPQTMVTSSASPPKYPFQMLPNDSPEALPAFSEKGFSVTSS